MDLLSLPYWLRTLNENWPRRISELRSMAYEDYLLTLEWAETRDLAIRLAGGRCQRCGEPASEVHHLTYERLGCERLRDLMPICERCHQNIHEENTLWPEAGCSTVLSQPA